MTTKSDDAIIAKALEIMLSRLKDADELVSASSPEKTREYLRLKLHHLEHEVFGMLFLDVKNKIIKDEVIFRGSLAHAAVYPREVVKECLFYNAASVIFYHNHPSGDCAPSDADLALTTNLTSALALVDIKVLDHIIFAGYNSYSFAEHGKI